MEKEIWNWTEHAVEMIPFGLLAGFCGEAEIRITKLAEEGFCFRTIRENPSEKEKFHLCFYDLQQNGYEELFVKPVDIKLEERTEVFTSYAVCVNEEAYRAAVQKLFYQYDRYIRLKLEKDDSGLAEALTGYPAKKDEEFAVSFAKQMEEWLEEEQGCRNEKKIGEVEILPELALELDCPHLYEAFLGSEIQLFLGQYTKAYGSLSELWKAKKPDRIYLGNAFCPLLFPENKMLFAMLEKAKREAFAVTLTFSYVREYQLSETETLLEKLQDWCRENETSLEIVVNDWAMADLLKDRTKYFNPCLGVLLNKRRKDPRMTYKKGDLSLLKQNPLNADFYREYLEQTFHMHRFEWESCGYEQQIPDAENHLHLPFYQTNTSQYCTLYAGTQWKDRGRQSLVTACDKRCEKQVYLYPKHLHMVGRYNSLFGLDTEILRRAGIVQGEFEKMNAFCKKQHIRRLVFGCL